MNRTEQEKTVVNKRKRNTGDGERTIDELVKLVQEFEESLKKKGGRK